VNRGFSPSLFATLIVLVTGCTSSQPRTAGDPPTTQPVEDSADARMAAALQRDGVRYGAGRVTVWSPRDSLALSHMHALADTLHRIVRDVEKFLRMPYDWTRYRRPHITYFVVGERFISHADERAHVFLPLNRVKDGTAPYIHETVHALTTPKHLLPWEYADSAAHARAMNSMAVWLLEGFASYVDNAVADRYGYRPSDIFKGGGNAHVDATCTGWLAKDEGKAILPYIGMPGHPPRLGKDRKRVAAPFYVCSQSYVKFLVARLGLTRVAALHGEPDVGAALRAGSGATPQALRANWLASIGVAATP
jgi:hypothetical protein